MAHYAFLDENNKVVEVIVGVDETATIEGKDPETWYGEFRGMTCKRTSYNTFMGKHFSKETGKWSKERQFRKNYAGRGYVYDETRDAFIPPKPYNSWVLNEETCYWDPPVPMPEDEGTGDPPKAYKWDEENIMWVDNPHPEEA